VAERGVLYPARLPTFHRLPAPDPVAALVRWFWIPEWQIAPGRSSRQHLIAFPACNLVVEPDVVGLAGPTTRTSYRDLVGTGWAVGALLRPAAVAGFVADPAALRDTYRPLDLPGLAGPVRRAMAGSGDRRRLAVGAFTDWLLVNAPEPTPDGVLANAMADLIETHSDIRTVEDVATRLGVSTRTLQRLARRHVGLSPSVMIRRRRLQQAAERLRVDPATSLAAVAVELGYADHAHLANEFRAVLGITLSAYRRQGAGSPTPPPPESSRDGESADVAAPDEQGADARRENSVADEDERAYPPRREIDGRTVDRGERNLDALRRDHHR
jgi:AraC-like DNA-binding protein